MLQALGCVGGGLVPFALSQLFGIDPEGVIVAGIAPGSPAVMAGLSPLDIVMEVDQVPTPDLG